MSVTTGSYKSKVEALASIVERRTAEARGWRQYAELRAEGLAQALTIIAGLESAFSKASLAEACGLNARMSALPSALNKETALSYMPEAVDAGAALTEVIAGLSEMVEHQSTGLDRLLKLANEDLSVPHDDEGNGLTMEEMGVYHHEPSPPDSSDEDEPDQKPSSPARPPTARQTKASNDKHKEKRTSHKPPRKGT